ncbi:hypothetical protein SBA2_300006 [Acidobacteriia bacterium SbA2]|nr:hypothetical protein SBA2_300006 [Acidobacteriia bacterium SbA2]
MLPMFQVPFSEPLMGLPPLAHQQDTRLWRHQSTQNCDLWFPRQFIDHIKLLGRWSTAIHDLTAELLWYCKTDSMPPEA